jgi:hypothetical protein
MIQALIKYAASPGQEVFGIAEAVSRGTNERAENKNRNARLIIRLFQLDKD